MGSPIPGPIFILVDCPTESHLEELLSIESLTEYYTDLSGNQTKSAKTVNCVIHLSPASVVNNLNYQKWMKKFGQVQHIVAGHEMWVILFYFFLLHPCKQYWVFAWRLPWWMGICAVCSKNVEVPILKSSARIAARLNYVCPQFFPAPGFWSVNQLNSLTPDANAASKVCHDIVERYTQIISGDSCFFFFPFVFFFPENISGNWDVGLCYHLPGSYFRALWKHFCWKSPQGMLLRFWVIHPFPTSSNISW